MILCDVVTTCILNKHHIFVIILYCSSTRSILTSLLHIFQMPFRHFHSYHPWLLHFSLYTQTLFIPQIFFIVGCYLYQTMFTSLTKLCTNRFLCSVYIWSLFCFFSTCGRQCCQFSVYVVHSSIIFCWTFHQFADVITFNT